MIDCHVHLRDEEQAEEETIAHGLKVAEDSGLDIILDMPNTKNPVINRQRVLKRFTLAQKADSPVLYGTYVGLTADREQIREAVELCREFAQHPADRVFVAGLKAFWGHSVGDLSIVDLDEQRFVISYLTELKYRGVLAGHYEKESLLKPELWNPKNPSTWNLARPQEAEIFSLQDIMTFALLYKFPGRLYVCHVSSPISVQLINNYKHSMKISCEVSPSHLLLDTSLMQDKSGVVYKVNPPLRDPLTRQELFKCFLNGEIDILATDHAPHTLEQKTGIAKDQEGKPIYMSGIQNLASHNFFVPELNRRGAGSSLITKMAFDNPCRIFNLSATMTNRPRRDHTNDYAFDPYKHLK